MKEKKERRQNFLSLSELAFDWKEFGSRYSSLAFDKVSELE